MTEMPDAERPDDLDRRIEANDRGEQVAPDAELDALADTARALGVHWSRGADVDADAVWGSVEAGMESTPQRGWRTWSRRFRARPLLLARGLPAVAVALVLMIAVVASALLTTSGTALAFQFLARSPSEREGQIQPGAPYSHDRSFIPVLQW